MSVPLNLEDQMADLYRRIAEVERRGQNSKRTGKIAEVDAAKGLARVELKEKGSDGKPYLTGWLPWGEIAAGSIKTFIPPSKGQQVKVVSENGDLSDAEIDMSLPSDENPRPHDKEGELVIDMHDGKFRIHVDKDGSVSLKVKTLNVGFEQVDWGSSGGGGPQ